MRSPQHHAHRRPRARSASAGIAGTCLLAAALAQAQPGAPVPPASAARPADNGSAPSPGPAPLATPAAPATPAAAKVVVSGTVPDEASRALILARVRELYGADRVLDQLGVGPLAAPPNWSQQVARLLTPELRRVTQGQLRIEGNQVEIAGQVDSAPTQAQVIKGLTSRLDNPTYAVRDGLSVGASGQQVLDAALARRIVEFESGNATLTAAGRQVLDELLPVLRQLAGRRFEIVGHTDGDGARSQNLVLSAARADSVKAYLVQHGIPAAALLTSGVGPDRPLADNATAEGRARNRRIEFRVLA